MDQSVGSSRPRSSIPDTTAEGVAKLFLEAVPQSMRAIRAQMRKASATAAGAQGSGQEQLTIPQFRVLLRLSRKPRSNRELAEWLGVSAPTMSKMIDLLCKRKLARRAAEGGDRRQIAVRCTEKGAELSLQIREAVLRALAARLAELPEDELKAMETGFRVMKGVIA